MAETQTAFAARIGWTRARLNEVIRGNRGITADAALVVLAIARSEGRFPATEDKDFGQRARHAASKARWRTRRAGIPILT